MRSQSDVQRWSELVVDSFSSEKRSELMRRVKRQGSAPEMLVRRALHRRGLRYNICDSRLPGSPDLSFPHWRVVVFIHGCFWHGHDCARGKLPDSNREFWISKIEANRCRDERSIQELTAIGWRVIVIWACEVGRKKDLDARMDCLAAQIRCVAE